MLKQSQNLGPISLKLLGHQQYIDPPAEQETCKYFEDNLKLSFAGDGVV